MHNCQIQPPDSINGIHTHHYGTNYHTAGGTRMADRLFE